MAKHKKEKSSSASAKVKSVAKQSSDNEPAKIWTDKRFAHLVNDPRFKGIPKREKKVKIDKRFQSMFEDERFNVKHEVDKYGRKVKQSSNDELLKYYELESSDDNQDNDNNTVKTPNTREKDTEVHSDKDVSDSDSDALELDEEEKAMLMSDKVKSRLENLNVDYARGEAVIATDSSSDDDSESDQADSEVFIEHVWGELDADAERTDDSSHRLALCNMDWDRVRAVDILVMLSSFLPRGSTILSVSIYPSEFGKERMKEEDERGPQELTTQQSDSENEADEERAERLREYQLNRLKYYYAVIECDSIETAEKLYKECDGVEYESTANKIDLRFIPDDMEFEDAPKDRCTELPEVGKYQPRVFTTTALNQAKVELTWDENDVERKEFNDKVRAGKLTELSEIELKKYVACSSSENDASDQDEQQRVNESDSDDRHTGDGKKRNLISKYKALLSDIKEQEEKEKNEKVEMEFTWKVNGDGEEAASSDEHSGAENERKRNDNANPFDKILQKAKEKKKRRKELKKKRKRGDKDSDSNDDSSSEEDLPYGVDLNDPFFASAFNEKEFDVKKPSKKLKKETNDEDADEEETARKRAELELMLDDGDDDKSHFNLKRIQDNEIDLQTVSKSKRKRILKKTKKQIDEQRQLSATNDDFDVDVEDDRFRAIFEKPEFNIDPTNPSFKKTKGMERLIEEKLRKRPLDDGESFENDVRNEVKSNNRDINTSLLVKNIKRKVGK